MKYPAYPDYRPVQNPNLRLMPAHWTVNRVKFVATVGNGSTPSRDESAYWQEGTFPWLNSSVVNQEVVTQADQFVTETALRQCHLPRVVPPAVLVGITGEGRTRGMATTLAIEATINQHLAFVKPAGDEVDVRFLRRVFDASYDHLRSESEGAGSTKGAITCEQIKEMALPIPPSGEQRAIAAFLDWRTAQIDALIAKKQALIRRLDEAFYARMAFVLTGKRSVSGSLRPSGVAWLGDVPAHWQVMKLSRVVEARCDGPFGSGLKSEHYVDQGVRVVRLQNIGNAEFYNGDAAFIDPEHYRELGDHDVLPGDLLIAGLGDNNTPVGRACVAPEGLGPAMVKADCFRYRLDTQMAHAPFIAYQLSISAWLLRGALASGVTRARMNLSATSDRVLAFPPIDEQKAIAIELDSERQRADSVKRKVHEAIERLTEYRSALITAAVTGQIDVRGVPVPAPV